MWFYARHFALLCWMALPVVAQEAVPPEATHQRVVQVQTVRADIFMAATAHPEATRVAQQMLARGGSVADALIAAQLVLGLVEPQSSGLGGGAFAVLYTAEDGRLTTLDARETAPQSATPQYWLDAEGQPLDWWQAVVGGASVGVPGTPALLEALHQRLGRLAWAELYTPAITLADEGFTISPRLADSIVAAAERDLDRFEPTRSYFFHADGRPRAAGERLRNPQYAATLRLLAEQGSAAFYRGELARAIIEAVRTPINPGRLTLDDLADYRLIERPPVCAPYRQWQICGMGPPSSGALTVGQILGLVEGFDLAAMGPSAEAAHLIAEASRLAYADRALYMADSDFVPVPTAGLLNRAYLAQRAQQIHPQQSIGQAKAGTPPQGNAAQAPDRNIERPGTTHISLVDAEGNWLSVTSTIETGFGSRVMVNGFLLNNELTDFSRSPTDTQGRAVANRVQGGKRPRSSMAPTLVLRDDEVILALGSPGGSRIIGYVVNALVGLLDWQLSPAHVLQLGHVVNRNGATELEQGTSVATWAEALSRWGHAVQERDLNSGIQLIRRLESGQLEGAADPRREGTVLGDP